jgi:hypothetical protein
MNQQLNYIIRDTNCKQALADLRTNISVPQWLDEHAALFKSISIAPEGRPSIASANYQGEHYEWISAFHRLYQTLIEYVVMDEG